MQAICVDLGEIYQQQEKLEEADKQFIEAVEIAKSNERETAKLANYFA